MSWETKQDYCGLAVESKLSVKSSTEGKTGQYLEKLGRLGSYAATKAFGIRAKPGNTYTVEDDVTITGAALGTVSTVDGKKFALQAIKWSTAADQEPTFEGSAEQVADAGATRNTFVVPEFKLSPDQVAQIPEFKFSGESSFTAAFSVGGSGCELTACGGEISCKVGTNDKNGYPHAHDVTTGKITLSLTIGQYGETAPTVTPATGWDVSSPLTSDDPDSDMPTWTCTLSRRLDKTMASQASQAS